MTGTAGIVVREAELADLSALLVLNEAVQALHVANRPELFRATEADEIERWFRDLFVNSNVKTWVALVDGTLSGYLVAETRARARGPYNFEQAWLELDQIGVAAEFRRQGVARALFESALAFARAQGISRVELSSWSFNREAHSAFQKLGFVPKVVRFEYSGLDG
jgi:GNAT superfamily N-acetyltransferase